MNRLAKEAGLSQGTIEQIEARHDTSVCRAGTLDAINAAFGRHGVKLAFGGAIRDQRPLETREYVSSSRVEEFPRTGL
jgi:hypothetical protein